MQGYNNALVAVASEVVVLAVPHAQLANDCAVVATGISLLHQWPEGACSKIPRPVLTILQLQRAIEQAVASIGQDARAVSHTRCCATLQLLQAGSANGIARRLQYAPSGSLKLSSFSHFFLANSKYRPLRGLFSSPSAVVLPLRLLPVSGAPPELSPTGQHGNLACIGWKFTKTDGGVFELCMITKSLTRSTPCPEQIINFCTFIFQCWYKTQHEYKVYGELDRERLKIAGGPIIDTCMIDRQCAEG